MGALTKSRASAAPLISPLRSLVTRASGVLRLVGKIWKHPANRGRRVATLVSAFRWLVHIRLSAKPWILDLNARVKIFCYPYAGIASRLIFFSGRPDFDETMFLERYLRPGDNFLDVGANVGFYTLLAADLVGTTGMVGAFEPGRETAGRLRENLELNSLGNVRVYSDAVGSAEGTAAFAQPKDDTSRLRTPHDSDVPIVDVRVVRLDSAAGYEQWAMGKMDIEGAEPVALEGASRMLAEANPPVWQLEINGMLRDYDWTEERFAEWLHAQGYDLALYDGRTGNLSFGQDAWRQRDNVLAIARSAREMVVNRIMMGRP